MSAIKFRKNVSEVYDTDITWRSLADKHLLGALFEVRNMIAGSTKPNKLRHLYIIRNTARNFAIQNRKIDYANIKVIALIINLEETISICNRKM